MAKKHIKIYKDLEQGTPEWFAARCGILTASEMKLIVTEAKLSPANNDKQRAHLYELLAQRINNYVEPHYMSDDMLRGHEDEVDARDIYADQIAEVDEVGFITNSSWGFTIGYSPDGLVGDDGLIEIKSRRQKYQLETILNDAVPSEYMIQIQTGMLVSGRKWCDFITYCGGMPMYVKRVQADKTIQQAILICATAFEKKIREMHEKYLASLGDKSKILIPTERREAIEEIII